VDGHVSRITNPTGNFGGGTWMLLSLNNHIAINMGALWPRLRDHPSCPTPLRFTSNAELIFPNAPPEFHI
jgi:hypothetical protein